jgi:hypothetical protein
MTQKRLLDLIAQVPFPPRETKGKQFVSYDDARKIVQAAGVTSIGKLQRWKARPNDVPCSPHKTYKESGWRGWGQFFGTEYLPYEEARTAVRGAGIKSWSEFSKWRDRPKNIPSAPQSVYAEWKGWREFVLPPGPRWLTHEEAQVVVREAGIKTAREYQRWKDRPSNVPAHPEVSYQTAGWRSWGDFLGTSSVVGSNAISYTGKRYLSYEEAQNMVRVLGITTYDAFQSWFRRSHAKGMPSNPHVVYKDKGWVSWPVFFGKALAKGARA